MQRKFYASSNIMPFRAPWIKFKKYNPIDVRPDTLFNVKIGVSRQL